MTPFDILIPRRFPIAAALAAAAVLSAGTFARADEPKKSEEKKADAKGALSTTPAPKYEKDGKTPQKGFIAKHESFLEIAKKGDVGVVFLGDSITQGWGGAGKEVWHKEYEPLKAANFGIGGDRTEHVLWRIANGELDGIKPKALVLMIGTNNSGRDSAEDIAAGVTAIVKAVREKLPETKVLLLAIFPHGEKPNPQREKIAKANEIIAKLDDGKHVKYLDIGPKFLGEGGVLSKDIMPDFLHLSPKGYAIWADAIGPTLKELMN
jgi:lysophospholipase L1-like esterase